MIITGLVVTVAGFAIWAVADAYLYRRFLNTLGVSNDETAGD